MRRELGKPEGGVLFDFYQRSFMNLLGPAFGSFLLGFTWTAAAGGSFKLDIRFKMLMKNHPEPCGLPFLKFQPDPRHGDPFQVRFLMRCYCCVSLFRKTRRPSFLYLFK